MRERDTQYIEKKSQKNLIRYNDYNFRSRKNLTNYETILNVSY